MSVSMECPFESSDFRRGFNMEPLLIAQEARVGHLAKKIFKGWLDLFDQGAFKERAACQNTHSTSW